MKRFFLIIPLLLLFCVKPVLAQNETGIVTRATVLDGDTVPYISLPEMKIFAPLKFKTKKEAIRFTRLVRYVKKVYPYARLAGIKVKEYSDAISAIPNEKERKRVMKNAEKELKAEFEGTIRQMTFTQGKILIKLIDRETGQTSYNIIKEFRGSIIAVFWQSFGKIFGMDLKMEYDPTGKDKEIERIVQMIENGAL